VRGAARGVRLLIALTLTSTAFAVITPSQAGAETFQPASDGSFLLSGHGFGHGRGMSQWGAFGMATAGQSAQQILDFYYPGSQTTTVAGTPTIKVLLKRANAGEVDIVAARGDETVTDSVTGTALALPAAIGAAPVTTWKATKAAAGPTVVSGFWSNAWHPFPVAGQLSTTGNLKFASDSGVVRLIYPDTSERDYQGTIDAVPNGPALLAVNTLALDDYLKGVVPHESINSWPAAALQAQAVAARTYADVRIGAGLYDICDDTQCQVYTGVASFDAAGNQIAALQFAESNAAIAAVAGQIRTYNGAAISTEYSSSNGGWTTTAGQPWEPAQPDPFDWTQTITAAALETAYPALGTPVDLTVNQRDGNGEWGGRVQSLTIDGSVGSVIVSGNDFRAAMGLRSTWWTVGPIAPSAAGYLHPLAPTRILDTRQPGNGNVSNPNGSPFGPGETRVLTVAGNNGIPADAVGVVLNVTVTDTTSTSYLTVWPRPYSRPTTSNLNWDRAGQTVANLVYTGLGPDGTVLLYNNAGNASVIVDVFGYEEPATVSGGLGFVPVSPNRIFDSRVASVETPVPAKLAAAESRSVAVTGTPGVRPDAQAALINVTGTGPTAESYLTVWPTGTAQPNTSNLNLLPGETRANAALGLLGGGSVSLYNNLGNTDAILDVMGQYVPADGTTGQFASTQPARLLDTRTSLGGHPTSMAPGETYPLQVLGRGGVPTSGVSAVVLNVTAIAPTRSTYVTVWPAGVGQPSTSNLNAAPGAVVPNLVIVAVGSGGLVDLYNNLGSTGLAVDVVGWMSG
jgi:SpoIID/LytB domain protein